MNDFLNQIHAGWIWLSNFLVVTKWFWGSLPFWCVAAVVVVWLIIRPGRRR